MLLLAILGFGCPWQFFLSIIASLTFFALAAVLWVTSDYVELAKKINVEWLYSYSLAPPASPNGSKKSGRCEEPIVIVMRWGEEIIGAIVLRFVKKERKGYVRAWTVSADHRNKGFGRELLECGVRVCWGKGARGLEFEEGHASKF